LGDILLGKDVPKAVASEDQGIVGAVLGESQNVRIRRDERLESRVAKRSRHGDDAVQALHAVDFVDDAAQFLDALDLGLDREKKI